MDTAVMGKLNSQEKLTRSNVMLDDMVNIICSNEQFKKFLIFRNQKCAANTNIFEKVAEEMNERSVDDGRKITITHSQIRNKFKRLVCECKSISLSQGTASGISRYQVEKGYGKWWDIFFPLVTSRESADPSNIVEPPFYNDDQNIDPENDLGGSKNETGEKKSECKPKKNKETIEQSLLTLTKSFIDNDPTEKMLKFMAEEIEKSRKHEMDMMKLMFSQQHPPFQEPSPSIPFHYHSPSSSGNSSPFQQIPFHQDHVTVERKGNPENQVSFCNVLQAPPSPTYNPTWPTYQGKHQK